MPVYKFLVNIPVGSTLTRDRYVNVFHMSTPNPAPDMDDIAGQVCGLWQSKYGSTTHEVNCRVYELGPPPNVPLANVTLAAGSAWDIQSARELALCLSFAGDNRGDKRRRGRLYLAPHITTVALPQIGLRPTQAQLDWALSWYGESNDSLPDLGGPDWTFGIWSEAGQHFTQSEQAWVNDDWDTQRRRGLRESNRVSVSREG